MYKWSVRTVKAWCQQVYSNSASSLNLSINCSLPIFHLKSYNTLKNVHNFINWSDSNDIYSLNTKFLVIVKFRGRLRHFPSKLVCKRISWKPWDQCRLCTLSMQMRRASWQVLQVVIMYESYLHDESWGSTRMIGCPPSFEQFFFSLACSCLLSISSGKVLFQEYGWNKALAFWKLYLRGF